MRIYELILALCGKSVEFEEQDGWSILKFNFGIALCWKNWPLNSAIATPVGNVYESPQHLTNFPTGLFKSPPVAILNCDTRGAQWVVAMDVTKDGFTAKLYYAGSYPTATNWSMNAFAIGAC